MRTDLIVIEALSATLAGIKRLENLGALMNEKLKAFAESVKASFTVVDEGLANIVKDEQGQADAIKKLQDQIANTQGDVLSPESQALLDELAAGAQALADRTKQIADSIPDVPAVPAE